MFLLGIHLEQTNTLKQGIGYKNKWTALQPYRQLQKVINDFV